MSLIQKMGIGIHDINGKEISLGDEIKTNTGMVLGEVMHGIYSQIGGGRSYGFYAGCHGIRAEDVKPFGLEIVSVVNELNANSDYTVELEPNEFIWLRVNNVSLRIDVDENGLMHVEAYAKGCEEADENIVQMYVEPNDVKKVQDEWNS